MALVDPRDMLNNFCFHVQAQKSLFRVENVNAFFLTSSSSAASAPRDIRVHRAGSQLKRPNSIIIITLKMLLYLVFILAMVTMCLACYSNWFKNRVEGYLWRCMFWSPVILLICVARQVGLGTRQWFFQSSCPPFQVTQSYLPRVVKPTAPVEKRKSSAVKETKSQ